MIGASFLWYTDNTAVRKSHCCRCLFVCVRRRCYRNHRRSIIKNPIHVIDQKSHCFSGGKVAFLRTYIVGQLQDRSWNPLDFFSSISIFRINGTSSAPRNILWVLPPDCVLTCVTHLPIPPHPTFLVQIRRRCCRLVTYIVLWYRRTNLMNSLAPVVRTQ